MSRKPLDLPPDVARAFIASKAYLLPSAQW
jgi:hypothetical protein